MLTGLPIVANGFTAPVRGAEAPAVPPSSLLAQLVRTVSNSASRLFALPVPDAELAWRQACQRALTASQNAGTFVATIRLRLQHPVAQQMMLPATVQQASASLSYWLPEPVQPQLSDAQSWQLMAFILGQPVETMARLACDAPALHHLLTDEIYRAAQPRQFAWLTLLPQLLRMPLVSQALVRCHPLLPTLLWATQLLWQVQRQGLVQALDSELKLQLHHCLMALESAAPASAELRQALSDKSLWLTLNRWLSQRLPQLSASASVRADHRRTASTNIDLPAAPGERVVTDWQLNSAVNQPAQQGGTLLAEMHRCYEFLQRQRAPLDITLDCPASVNQSASAAEAGEMQLFYSLVLDEAGEMHHRLRMESGDVPLLLRGVDIPAQSRPQRLTPIAGAGDRVTLRPLSEESETFLASAALSLAKRQLAEPETLSAHVRTINAAQAKPAAAAPGGNRYSPSAPPATAAGHGQILNRTAGEPPAGQPGSGLLQLLTRLGNYFTAPASTSSAWPLPGSAAQELPARTAELRWQGNQQPVSPEDFVDSLALRYPADYARDPQVTVTQTVERRHKREIWDMEMPLVEALNVVQQAQEENSAITLNPSPAWSRDYRASVEEYLSGKTVADYHTSRALNPEEPHNRAASWRLASRMAREGLENSIQSFARLKSPLWNITQWHDNKIDTLLREHGLEGRGYHGETVVGVGVNLPAHPGLHNPPMADRQYDGSWQPVGNYTLRQITAREHLRGSFKLNQLVLRYPAGFSAEAIQALESLDLERDYAAELKETLSDPEVRIGLKVLMRSQLNKVVESYLDTLTGNTTHFSAQQVKQAADNDRYGQVQWHEYALHNVVYLAVEPQRHEGLLISLWDKQVFAVQIDQGNAIRFYDGAKASDFVALMAKSMPIKGRQIYQEETIRNGQLIINPRLHSKNRYARFGHEYRVILNSASQNVFAVREEGILENELLNNFAVLLLTEVDYLFKSDNELRLDFTIELFTTIVTLVNLYVLPPAFVSAITTRTASAMLYQSISHWKTGGMLTLSGITLPKLVEGTYSDRPADATKAYIDAVLSLFGEAVSAMLNKYAARVLVGLFYQAGKPIKMTYRQLPEAIKAHIARHVKRFNAAYARFIYRALGLPLDAAAPGVPAYDFPFIDIKAPAPVRKVTQDFGDLTTLLHAEVKGIPDPAVLLKSNKRLPDLVQQYMQKRGYQCDIGEVSLWSTMADRQPRKYYVVRVKSPAPDRQSLYAETEDIIIDCSEVSFRENRWRGQVITGEDRWRSHIATLPDNKDMAVDVEWFRNMQQVDIRLTSLMAGHPLPLISFINTAAIRPFWVKRALAKSALERLAQRQMAAVQRIWQQQIEEAARASKIMVGDSLSLKLSHLFSRQMVAELDSLGQYLHTLVTHPISKRPVAFSLSHIVLTGTDLRGISSDNAGNITLFNYAASADDIRDERIQGYAPHQLADAGLAAEASKLYAPQVDERYSVHQNVSQSQRVQKRFAALQSNQHWLQQTAAPAASSMSEHQLKAPDAVYLVPLIIGLDRTRLNGQADANNRLATTLPVAAIRFVLAPQEDVREVRELLGTLLDKAIPVSPLLIEDVPEVNRTLERANDYAFFPELEPAQQAAKYKFHQPWQAIIDLQAQTQQITPEAAARLRENTATDQYAEFLAHAPQVISSLSDLGEIEPGARIALFDLTAGPGEPPLCHAMVMVEEGAAVGISNHIIGGQLGWEKHYLATLPWREDEQSGFVLVVNGRKLRMMAQKTLLPVPSVPSVSLQTSWSLENSLVLEQAEIFAAHPASWQRGSYPGGDTAWGAIMQLYQKCGAMTLNRVKGFISSISATDYHSLLNERSQLIRSYKELLSAPAGAHLLLLERQQSEGQSRTTLVHALIISQPGQAIGFDNQLIGRGGGWERISLSQLNYHMDSRSGLMIEVGDRLLHLVVTPRPALGDTGLSG